MVFFWRKIRRDVSRTAKPYPWWEFASQGIYLGSLVTATTAFIYGGRQFYMWYVAEEGNLQFVESSVREYMQNHPKLAVATIRMTTQHVLCAASTPFGAPMLCPPELEPEGREVYEFLMELRKHNPHISLADLWVLASGFAVSGIGGPYFKPNIGERDASTLEFEVRPGFIDGHSSDIGIIKKVFADQGFSLSQSIALIGGWRGVGYHTIAYKMNRNTNTAVNKNPKTFFRACCNEESLFGHEYFCNVMNNHWVAVPNAKIENADAEIKAHRKEARRLTRVAEKAGLPAPTIKPLPTESLELQQMRAALVFTTETPGMDMVSMQQIDLCLMPDGLISAWLSKFVESEVKFFDVYGEALKKLHNKGYSHLAGTSA